MLYSEYLKELENCPFCADPGRKLLKNKHAYLTYALSPYSKYHLLAIPNKHIENLKQLRKIELKSIYDLLDSAIKILEAKGIDDYTILARNGNTGKSIKHLHFNLIPKHHIGDLDENCEKRKILDKKAVQRLVADLEKTINKLK